MDRLDDQRQAEEQSQEEDRGSSSLNSIQNKPMIQQGKDDPTSLENIKYFWHDDSGRARAPGYSSSGQVQMAMSANGDTKTKKRIFICCDGTWQNAIGTNRPLTNVARFASSVTPTDEDGITQIVYYTSGIGSKPDNTTKMPKSVVEWVSDVPAMGQRLGDRYAKYFGGGTGTGITGNILGAYYFLCLNYNFRYRKDEIILAGFSRGAYTVRCLASFISRVGLIRRKALSFLQELFREWKDESSSLQGQIESLKNKKLLFETSITVCAEWDSVSAVWSPALSHVQDRVPKNVENAFHAVALHEKRSDFQPVLWRSREARDDGRESTVKQCLFFGCHSDVGGGNVDPGLATVSLLWMVSQVRSVCRAQFDSTTLLSFFGPRVTEVRRLRLLGSSTTQQLDSTHMECHVFAKGKVEDSYQPLWWVRGKSSRRLLLFPCPAPCTSHKPQCAARPLTLTIHFSVRILMKERNEPCKVLKGYEFNDTESCWKKQDDPDDVVHQYEDDGAYRIEQEWLIRWYIRGWNIVAAAAKSKSNSLDDHYFENTVPRPLPEDRKKSLIELLKENHPDVGDPVREFLERIIKDRRQRSEDRHQAWASAILTPDWDVEDRSDLESDEVIQDHKQEEERRGREQGRTASIGPGIDGMRFRRQESEELRAGRVRGRNRSIR
ncbi:hypothetical protein GGR58DRAFT_138914 [Xylaria digitata]|nr:hypothetical protein GGR58DRAFT_138914 [Xylaria digitata]